MSGRVKMIQMVPMTFQGMSSGRARITSTSDTAQPLRGMANAINTPSGISISSTIPENRNCRSSASCRRVSPSTSRYHSVPTQ